MRNLLPAALVVLLLSLAFSARADVKTAQSFLTEAKEEFTNHHYSDATEKLELAEGELDGVADADKAPVLKDISELKKQIADRLQADDKRKFTEQLERVMRDGENAIGEPSSWKRTEEEANALFNDPAAKTALGEELTAAQAKFAAFQKLHVKKAAKKLAQQASADMKELTDGWSQWQPQLADPNLSADSRSSILSDAQRAIDKAKESLAALPPDDPAAKEYTAKIEEMNAAMSKAALSGDAKDFAEKITERVNDYKSQWEGWEAESDGPTWDELVKGTAKDVTYFNAPKTAKLLETMNENLADWAKDERYLKVASDPQVKKLIDQLTADRDAAKAKLLKSATAVVEQAEKAGATQEVMENSHRLKEVIRIALDEAPEAKPLEDRVEALNQKFFADKKSADKATDDLNKQLTEQAATAWPAMKAKFIITENFDPAKYKDFQGKTIAITTDNLMGYNFKEGDFPFATTLNGHPVAARYSPQVEAAIAEVQKKVDHTLSQYDGKWEIIATVDGTTGQLLARRQTEGDVRVNGDHVGTVKTESVEAVEAPIITIIAARCGPLAVAAGQGTVKEDGKIGAMSGSSASGSGAGASGWATRILAFLVGITAAGLCLLKAKFAPLATVPQVGQVSTQIGNANLSLVGLACAFFGAWWLLSALLHFAILPMLVGLGVVAAGLYVGLDFLEARGIVKPGQTAALKPLGVPVGLACAVLALIALL